MFCRYFSYEQREADIVLEALVRKTEVIQKQLGSAGQVIEKRITDRLAAAASTGRGEGARQGDRGGDRRRAARARPRRDG